MYKRQGFYYAPDPSSQIACSIGGNVAENSGGVHSLKYGATTNNLLGIQVVLMDGTVTKFGGKAMDAEGYDFLGLMTGSEGLLGVITEVTVKILKSPEVVKAALVGFPSIEDAGNCVAEIIAEGCIPAGMEIMDKALTKATNDYSKAGYPTDAEAMMIVEFDGTEHEVEAYIQKTKEIAEKNNSSSLKISKSNEERLKFWAGRKAALVGFPSIEDAGNCVAEIIAEGCIPAGMEIMDKALTKATNDYSKAGYPTDAEAMMIVEFDGTEHEVEAYIQKTKEIAEKNNSSSLKISKSNEERLKFWAGRKAAFPACGVLAPDYMCMDGSIPRKTC